jgi:hypothetical protein
MFKSCTRFPFFNFKFKLQTIQCGFIQLKFMVTTLVSYQIDLLPSVCLQGEFDSVHFDLSQAFNKVLLAFLLDMAFDFGRSLRYVTLSGPEVTYHLDLPSFAFILPVLCYLAISISVLELLLNVLLMTFAQKLSAYRSYRIRVLLILTPLLMQ